MRITDKKLKRALARIDDIILDFFKHELSEQDIKNRRVAVDTIQLGQGRALAFEQIIKAVEESRDAMRNDELL